MSDPTNPVAPAAQEPAAAPPAAATPSAPAPAAAAPQTAPEAPARPPYVNPWKGRAPVAAKPEAPAAAPPPPVAAAPQPDPLAALRADVEGLRGIIGRTVEQDLATVPANVATAVRAASADPIEQRRLLDVLRANGIAVSPTAAPAPIAPAATTINAPPVAAPEVRTQESGDADLLTHYQKLKASGAHYAASNFLIKHSDAITRAQARQSTH